MEYEMTFHFTKEEYETLMAEAELTGQEMKALISEWLDQIRIRQMRFATSSLRSPAQQAVSEALYKAGVTSSMPTGKTLTAEQKAKLQRLAELFGHAGGKSGSEMVIEDRGPY